MDPNGISWAVKITNSLLNKKYKGSAITIDDDIDIVVSIFGSVSLVCLL